MNKNSKDIGLLELFSFAAGSMISSGLFILPAIAYREAGPAAVLAYILAGVLMLPSLYSKTELATAMPKAGGTYFYVERILGTPTGIIAGFANWFSISAKSAFSLVAIGTFSKLLFPDLSITDTKLIAIAFCILFTLINLSSVKSSSKFQVWLISLVLAALGIYILLGYRVVDFKSYSPFFQKDYVSILEATGLVFISYGGLTKITSIAEEVKNAGKVLPKAMFMAFFIVTTVYVLVVGITIGILPNSVLSDAKNFTPITDAAGVFLGNAGMVVMSIAAVIAFTTNANAGILAASHDPMAMSRDGLMPEIFSKLGEKSHTPKYSILFTSLFMITIISFLSLEVLVKVASTFMILLFIMVNISLIVVRYSKMRNYRPSYRSPFFPWMQIFGIMFYSILIAKMGPIPLLITIVFIIFAYLWYKFYAQEKAKSVSALLKLTEKILNRQLVPDESTELLEEELLDILRDRENIIEDRFDELIKNCKILEFTEKMNKFEFFKEISKELEDDLDILEEEIYHKFREREQVSNTNIHTHIAIPHIIIEGKNKFDIMLARNKAGINWAEDQEPVYTVFVLIGTMDERNYHLRALMAIAQIVQEKDFMLKWLTAGDVEHLRSSILLSNRKRDIPRRKTVPHIN